MVNEQFSDAVYTIYAAKRLIAEGPLFNIMYHQINYIIEAVYEKYPDELDLDEEIVRAKEETLKSAFNSLKMVKDAYSTIKTQLLTH